MRRDQVSQELNVCYDPEGFRASVQQELDHELALLAKAKRPFKEGLLMHTIALVLLGISGAIIYLDSQALYLWLFIGLLLYSYNFLTLLNPSTTIKPRPKELSELREQGKDDRWMVIRLLLKKRKLAIEIGLTVFLVGNIPLVLSFSMIFGLGVFFLVYFAEVTHVIDWNMVSIVVVQILLILGFQIFLYILKPESQGLTQLARSMKGRLVDARTKSWVSILSFLTILIALLVVSAVLIIGAMLLPNYTMYSIWARFIELGQSSVLLLIIVIVIQVFIVRHFEAHESRIMAIRLLVRRTNSIRKDVLDPFDDLMLQRDKKTQEQFEAEFLDIRKKFYAIVIYQIVNIDIFGMSPVFLVGPRLKYLLDDKVLNHFHD